ncbi:hypothetical protein BH20ACT23_BH20ACT23_29510 [soil metagenome]
MERDDVGMTQPSRSPGLPSEALDELRVARELVVQSLDRYLAVEQLVVCEVDLGHTPATHTAPRFIAPPEDSLTCVNCHAPATPLVISRQ